MVAPLPPNFRSGRLFQQTKNTAAHVVVRRWLKYSLVTICYVCCTAVSFHGFGPTGRVKVQYSSNSIGSELLPLTTFPLF
jgi:hypothetical protein